jgi:hypothetical protein
LMNAYPGGVRITYSGSTVVFACGVSTPTNPFGAYSTLTTFPLLELNRVAVAD